MRFATTARRATPRTTISRSEPDQYGRRLYNEAGFRSGGEQKFASDLTSRGLKYRYEDPAEKIPYVIAHVYNPDFSIERPDGSRLIVEYKGYFDQDDRRKHKAIKEANPGLDIRFVFDRPGNVTALLRKGAKSTIRDWLEKYGFKWAIGYMPEEWLFA